jgi:hypothetical protein
MTAAVPGVASAQAGGVEWADIDCAESRIAPTDGLRCRATAVLTSDMYSTGQGNYRFWSAFGPLDGVKYSYYVAEALNPKSAIIAKQGLPDAVRVRSPQGKGSTNMSDVTQRQDADFVSFESADKESCVGIRKSGPPRADGMKWILYATRCAPAGKSQTDAEIAAFVHRAKVRE